MPALHLAAYLRGDDSLGTDTFDGGDDCVGVVAAAGCSKLLVEDLRSLLHEWGLAQEASRPQFALTAARCNRPPESGVRAGYDGAKRRKGSKAQIAVDTLGHLVALTVTPADQGDREQVAALAEQVQQVTGGTVELAYADQGYTGPNAAADAAQQYGLRLEVVKHPMAKRGFVLLPRRWVVERSFAWTARFRRFARGYGRLDTNLKGIHLLAFATLMLQNLQHPQPKFLTGSSLSTLCMHTAGAIKLSCVSGSMWNSQSQKSHRGLHISIACT